MSTVNISPEGLLYSKSHEWINYNKEDETALIGITDFAQSNLGDIVFVELPPVDDSFEIEGAFGVVESIKSVSDLFIPLSATILEVNSSLEDSPELLNESAYENWIVKVKVNNSSEVSNLLNSKAYDQFCESES